MQVSESSFCGSEHCLLPGYLVSFSSSGLVVEGTEWNFALYPLQVRILSVMSLERDREPLWIYKLRIEVEMFVNGVAK